MAPSCPPGWSGVSPSPSVNLHFCDVGVDRDHLCHLLVPALSTANLALIGAILSFCSVSCAASLSSSATFWATPDLALPAIQDGHTHASSPHSPQVPPLPASYLSPFDQAWPLPEYSSPSIFLPKHQPSFSFQGSPHAPLPLGGPLLWAQPELSFLSIRLRPPAPNIWITGDYSINLPLTSPTDVPAAYRSLPVRQSSDQNRGCEILAISQHLWGSVWLSRKTRIITWALGDVMRIRWDYIWSTQYSFWNPVGP